MKMSSKTEYALKTVLDLSIHGRNSVVRIAEIAKRQNIPVKFLEQILLLLKSARIVESQRGARGGYTLVASPSSITIASIVRLTDDLLLASAYPAELKKGRRPAQLTIVPFSEIWLDINNYVKEKLEKTTIQHMRDRMNELSDSLAAQYDI